MSFLYRSSAPLIRTVKPATRGSSLRAFSTTLQQRMTATDTVKDSAKTVDRTVADAAVAGIEKGQEAAGKAKETIGMKAKQAEGPANKAKGEAQIKAEEVKSKVS